MKLEMSPGVIASKFAPVSAAKSIKCFVRIRQYAGVLGLSANRV